MNEGWYAAHSDFTGGESADQPLQAIAQLGLGGSPPKRPPTVRRPRRPSRAALRLANHDPTRRGYRTLHTDSNLCCRPHFVIGPAFDQPAADFKKPSGRAGRSRMLIRITGIGLHIDICNVDRRYSTLPAIFSTTTSRTRHRKALCRYDPIT